MALSGFMSSHKMLVYKFNNDVLQIKGVNAKVL